MGSLGSEEPREKQDHQGGPVTRVSRPSLTLGGKANAASQDLADCLVREVTRVSRHFFSAELLFSLWARLRSSMGKARMLTTRTIRCDLFFV